MARSWQDKMLFSDKTRAGTEQGRSGGWAAVIRNEHGEVVVADLQHMGEASYHCSYRPGTLGEITTSCSSSWYYQS
ncbi:hypothetical protein FRX31_029584 [Thalictrum thalictroides]|uniref:Uncharacterized protein n=1 Tax=Thalictrum thalictroides TaxID=46969 RepID=A0A7J6V829_THATH|nr:hypothetical protein FRX31_029584 [Thalictrum thalictroides]